MPLHDSVEVCDGPSVMLVGLREQLRPVLGATDASKSTVPVNPLTGDTVTVDVPVVSARTVTLAGLVLTEKSGTATLYATVVE